MSSRKCAVSAIRLTVISPMVAARAYCAASSCAGSGSAELSSLARLPSIVDLRAFAGHARRYLRHLLGGNGRGVFGI
jgi:hypothetical protein